MGGWHEPKEDRGDPLMSTSGIGGEPKTALMGLDYSRPVPDWSETTGKRQDKAPKACRALDTRHARQAAYYALPKGTRYDTAPKPKELDPRLVSELHDMLSGYV